MVIDAFSPVGLERKHRQANAVSHEIARYREASLAEAPEPLPGQPSGHFRTFYNNSMVNSSAAAMHCGLGSADMERVPGGYVRRIPRLY